MNRRIQSGFTLIEIMVVVVIIGILGVLVVPNFIDKPDQARQTAAKTDLRAIASALDLYRLDNYNYPSTDQGLEALTEKPSGDPEAKNWNPEGYLPNKPVDPWGNPYQYLSPGAEKSYDLYSLGSDGREGGEGYAADLFH